MQFSTLVFLSTALLAVNAVPTAVKAESIEERSYVFTDFACNTQGSGGAPIAEVIKMRKTLADLGNVNACVEAKSCARVACSGGGAIYWCNENTTKYCATSYSDVAAGAYGLQYRCGTNSLINGEVSEISGWNVKVRAETC